MIDPKPTEEERAGTMVGAALVELSNAASTRSEHNVGAKEFLTTMNRTFHVAALIVTLGAVACATNTSPLPQANAPIRLAAHRPTPTPTATTTPSHPPLSSFFPLSAFHKTVVNPIPVASSASMLATVLTGGNYTLQQIQFTVSPTPPANWQEWSTPVYFASATDPVYTYSCYEPWGTCENKGVKVPIPIGALPEGTSDGHMAVLYKGVEYDGWLVPIPNGKGGPLSIGWGGNGPTGPGTTGYNMQADAAGFALTLGMVTPEEMLAGSINHAVAIGTPAENGHVAPAVGDDGSNQVPGAPPIGAHVWLSTSDAAINSSGASPWAIPVLHALHQYGAYIEDRCTQCILGGLQVENAVSYTALGLHNPWNDVASKYNLTPDSSGFVRAYINTGTIDLSKSLEIIQ